MEKTGYLIIGSGIAGLSFALKAARDGKVTIVTKNAANESNTRLAQGGIACVMSSNDNLELHIQDTLVAGAGLCNEEAVRTMVYEARNCIDDLINMGVHFSVSEDHLDLGLEGGHTRNRIAHVKDFTGREIENVLINAVRKNPNIKLLENHMAIDLVIQEPGSGMNEARKCIGAEILDETTGQIEIIYAPYTVICTGGAGQVYLHTTNPAIATGDGVAMAYRAGATIADMEFVQFHPTALYFPGQPVFLISEALRGAGAILKNNWGEAFMEKYHPLGSLAPRDITSRAIDNEMRMPGTDHVYLDATGIPAQELISLFPNIYENCLNLGIDITTMQIPVVPSAHFMCGGIATDLNGRTGIESLYAFGEAACTGVHGANRLASNSLLEAMVFSNRAFKDIQNQIIEDKIPEKQMIMVLPDISSSETDLVHMFVHEIKMIMSQYGSIIRQSDEMKDALAKIDNIKNKAKGLFSQYRNSREVVEFYNLAIIAGLILDSALKRKTSVGAHFVSENDLHQMLSEADTISINSK